MILESAALFQWFAVQIKPNSQQIAERNLNRQGFRTFAPVQSQTQRRAGRFEQVLRPLFPGYLFISFDPEAGAWRSINSTYGVSRLVSFGPGGTPVPVPDALMSALQRRCDARGLLRQAPELRRGDSVRIANGPFADFVATVESFAPQQRVWLLLELMGGTTRVAVPAQDVEGQLAMEPGNG